MQFTEQSRTIRQLETKLLQLEGPKTRAESVRLRVDSIREGEQQPGDDNEASQ